MVADISKIFFSRDIVCVINTVDNDIYLHNAPFRKEISNNNPWCFSRRLSFFLYQRRKLFVNTQPLLNQPHIFKLLKVFSKIKEMKLVLFFLFNVKKDGVWFMTFFPYSPRRHISHSSSTNQTSLSPSNYFSSNFFHADVVPLL